MEQDGWQSLGKADAAAVGLLGSASSSKSPTSSRPGCSLPSSALATIREDVSESLDDRRMLLVSLEAVSADVTFLEEEKARLVHDSALPSSGPHLSQVT